MSPESRITENLQAILGRISQAAAQSGRTANAIRLVAVTKFAPAEHARALHAAGCADLGESRPQELWAKAEALADLPVRWHMVGHLQRNKTRRTLPLAWLIHSLDSPRLAEELNAAAAELNLRVRALIEVNTSGDAAKHGFTAEAARQALPSLAALPNLEIRGLMTLASLEGGLDTARRNFAALRALRDRMAAEAPPHLTLEELSMGMSGDYEAAIAEGATLVRIGSALFEGMDVGQAPRA